MLNVCLKCSALLLVEVIFVIAVLLVNKDDHDTHH